MIPTTTAPAAVAAAAAVRAMNPVGSLANSNLTNSAVGLQNIKDLILLQQQQLQQAQLQQQIAHQQAHQLAASQAAVATLTPESSPRQAYPINPLILRGAYPTNGKKTLLFDFLAIITRKLRNLWDLLYDIIYI